MDTALIAAKRFGLGPKPGELAFLRDDPRGILLEALKSGSSGSAPVSSSQDHYAAVLDAFDWLSKRREILKKDKSEGAARRVREKMGRNLFLTTYNQLAIDKIRNAVESQTPLHERLVQYWANHFATSVAKSGPSRILASDFELHAIRPHVLGKFRDMLHAAAKHPMMLIYLDNRKSIGPNSKVGRRKKAGLNENLAREILELHTLGADGGYTQDDVTSFARVLTGWTINGKRGDRPFQFIYRDRFHEPGDHVVLGTSFPDDGMAQGEAVLDMIAAHPSTARNVARRMCRHFVSFTPPQQLVDSLEKAFLETDGDLAEVTRALIVSDLAWQSEPVKTLPPYDFLVAAYRATGAEFNGGRFLKSLNDLGQAVWAPPSPEGWPEENDAWLSPASLVERLDVASTIAMKSPRDIDVRSWVPDILGNAVPANTTMVIDRAESRQQAIALALMTPEFQRR